VRDHRFVIYGGEERPSAHAHLSFNTYSRERFIKDLTECAGAITNCGFSLSSEALHLGKKLLVYPLRRQMEQLSNARVIAELKLGSVCDSLAKAPLANWLKMPMPKPMNYAGVVPAIVQWIGNGNWDRWDDLVTVAWSGIELPGR
jgi:uncharacterized protein (TIGR00661 family)